MPVRDVLVMEERLEFVRLLGRGHRPGRRLFDLGWADLGCRGGAARDCHRDPAAMSSLCR